MRLLVKIILLRKFFLLLAIAGHVLRSIPCIFCLLVFLQRPFMWSEKKDPRHSCVKVMR